VDLDEWSTAEDASAADLRCDLAVSGKVRASRPGRAGVGDPGVANARWCADLGGHGATLRHRGRRVVRGGSDPRLDVRTFAARAGIAGVAQPEFGQAAGAKDSVAVDALTASSWRWP